MADLVSDAIEFVSFGAIDDPFGIESSQEAITQAADVQQEATAAGQAEIARQFDITQANLQPFQEAGVSAVGQQQALLGLSGEEAQQQAFAGLQESPGQQFLRERQQRALVRNASAIGGLGGGNVRTALQQQAVGFAQQDIQNQFGRLGQLAGQGATVGTNVGQFGQSAAAQGANLGVAGAEARASGILGRASIVPQLTGQLLETGGQFAGAAFGAF